MNTTDKKPPGWELSMEILTSMRPGIVILKTLAKDHGVLVQDIRKALGEISKWVVIGSNQHESHVRLRPGMRLAAEEAAAEYWHDVYGES